MDHHIDHNKTNIALSNKKENCVLSSTCPVPWTPGCIQKIDMEE